MTILDKVISKEEWLGLIAEKNTRLFDYINGVGGIGHLSNKYYLCYMAVRLLELHRILKITGSIYLHCDQTMSHYLKLLMDVIFGEHNFRNEITWRRSTAKGARGKRKTLGKVVDIILFYSKSEKNIIEIPKLMDKKKVKKDFKYRDDKGGI